MAATLSKFRDYLELIRFSHTIFALPFALLGVVLACAVPTATPLTADKLALRTLAVVLCMVTARSAAMAFNRLADAAIDGRNPRTAGRHLPSGRLSRPGVWLFFVGMLLAFWSSCALFLPNWIPLAGALPVLVWICGYSYAKRFTSAAHLWLGIALALSPICAWLAMRGEQVLLNPADVGPAVGLAIAVAAWVMGFDIIYACQDAQFDQAQGLHSVPARLGVAGALRVAAAAHLFMLAALVAWPLVFPQLGLGLIYYTALAIVAVLVIVQHRLVSPHDLARVNMAFFNVNAIISFGLCLATAVDALTP